MDKNLEVEIQKKKNLFSSPPKALSFKSIKILCFVKGGSHSHSWCPNLDHISAG